MITSVTSIHSTHQGTHSRRTTIHSCLTPASAQMIPSAKRWPPMPEPQGSTSIDKTTSRAMQEGPSSPKKHETPDWFTTLKPSCTEAFLQDSSIVNDARACFFSKHSYNFINDGTHNLSNVFKGLAKSTGLLGKVI